MAKTSSDPIDANDMQEFVAGQSALQFEMLVMRTLHLRNFIYEHGGTYIDPFQKKPRQFDFRAYRSCRRREIRLAVECKSITSPLLVSCVPRHKSEAFHQVMHREAITVCHSLYEPQKPVGKTIDQVVRLKGQLGGGDKDIYEKWAQAVSSGYDLAHGEELMERASTWVVLPILVVPDGLLWRVVYDFHGEIAENPTRVNEVLYYLGAEYEHLIRPTYRVSHLALMTVKGLDCFAEQFEKTCLNDEGPGWEAVFS